MKDKYTKISFLATGDEIIEGEIKDSNGQYFAHTLHDLGASIYQHVQSSDNRDDICQALRYLLIHSDVVIITGGLGPTSDDNTRFAVSTVTEQSLVFNEGSWDLIKARFECYQLPLTESNRQQALFPQDAVRFLNPNGTAEGCYVKSMEKHIYMLPGPPKECLPMFEKYVIPQLKQLSCFKKRETFRWLTMGLSESQIAETIDALAKPHGFETGFRWSYPYLEIKVHAPNEVYDKNTLDEINALLGPYVISTDRRNAIELLESQLSNDNELIYIQDGLPQEDKAHRITHPRLVYIDGHENADRLLFIINASPPLDWAKTSQGTVTLSCEGFIDGAKVYEYVLKVPNRGSEISLYVKHYMAWQIGRWITAVR